MQSKIITLFVALLVTATQTFAGTADDSLAKAKGYFVQAKAELENMLDGKAPLSYERAIFLIENAWWDGKMDYAVYQKVLSSHAQRIQALVSNAYHKPNLDSLSLYQRTYLSPKDRINDYGTALSNWAIFKYITDTTLFFSKDQIFFHLPYTYSFSDPMGSTDWTNTQVSTVLDEGGGNCFALASLFKIFSDRLHSEAWLCTAPSHIYIRHNDNEGRPYNIELSNGGSFPGSGTIQTFTHTGREALMSNIALRDLKDKQAIALCLVYLAKGYEHKTGIKSDDFVMACAEKALSYDDMSLNAMLLKSEVLETRILAKGKTVQELQGEPDFVTYQNGLAKLFDLGYREMPMEMKNLLLRRWTKDSTTYLFTENHAARKQYGIVKETRKASLSWGAFDEEISTKPLEQYGKALFDAKAKMITAFVSKDYTTYNDYNFDPIAFGWNIDPLAHKYPGISPYVFVNDNPIMFKDGTGAYIEGSDGKPVTYKMLTGGGIQWSANASDDIKRLGSAMLKTKTGTEQFNLMQKTKYAYAFVFNKENNVGRNYAETQLEFKDEEHPSYKNIKRVTTTFFMGIMQRTIDEKTRGDEQEKKIVDNKLTLDDMLGANGSHESVHGADKKAIKDYIDYYDHGKKDIDLEKAPEKKEDDYLNEIIKQKNDNTTQPKSK